MHEAEQGRSAQALLPHLDAAFNLARWLVRNEHEAEDLVQEAYLRGLKSFAGFHGTDGRTWLLAIVRNSCYDWLQRRKKQAATTTFQDEIHSATAGSLPPESPLLREEEQLAVRQALEMLPVEFREVVVLRELEGLSYKEIAAVIDIPIRTVMSRLGRGREHLQTLLRSDANRGP